jgi:methylthioribose-1-phosphate isomerase
LIKSNIFGEKKLLSAAERLKRSRPTAVNLQWAVDRMTTAYRQNKPAGNTAELLSILKNTALNIHDEDRLSCRQIGEFGSAMVKNNFNILTHCNAGILATGGIGTALSVIYTAAEQKKKIHVYVDETRPVGQGARLTFWELTANSIPATLIADNMAGSLMKDGKIDMILVGADRIALNGDTANKIGTYPLSVLASYHKIPFYVAAPISTFDKSINSGEEIPIEYRNKNELLSFWNIREDIQGSVYNPAFDVTPADLISGIITERGILRKPLEKTIKTMLT